MKKNLAYQYVKNYHKNPISYGSIDLLQIGTSHCEANANIESHMHSNFYELTIITSGKGIVTTNNVPVPVEQNDIYVSFPFEQHSIDAPPDMPMHYDHCAFFINDPDLLAEMQQLVFMHGNPEHRIIKNEQLKRLVSDAIYETSKLRANRDFGITQKLDCG